RIQGHPQPPPPSWGPVSPISGEEPLAKVHQSPDPGAPGRQHPPQVGQAALPAPKTPRPMQHEPVKRHRHFKSQNKGEQPVNGFHPSLSQRPISEYSAVNSSRI